MIWDLHQEIRINQAASQADRAGTAVSRIEGDLAELSRRVERLTLACQALWELLRETPGFTDAHLSAKIQEIDLRDGRADGKIGTQSLDCKSCGAKSHTRRTHCVMCGAVLEKPHAFT